MLDKQARGVSLPIDPNASFLVFKDNFLSENSVSSKRPRIWTQTKLFCRVDSSIYFKTVDQEIEDLEFSQQFYHQFSCNSQEFTNLTPLNEKTLKKVYSSLCFKIGLIWLIKKLKILDFFQGF